MILTKILATFFAAYAFICLYIYLFQENQILFPPSSSFIAERIPAENKIQLEINGITIHGIYSSEINAKKPIIIYFGGNAEDVFYNFPDFMTDLNAQFFAFNYRGYAGNEGKPTIKTILQDSEIIIEKIIQKFSINKDQIILVGRSLGAAIAVQQLTKHNVAGVVLISPFDSLVNIGKRYFPWLPVSLLVKHPLDSLSIGKKSKTPLIILAGEQDQIIPISYSKNLYNAWASPQKLFVTIKDTGHNTIHGGRNYFSSINQFIHSTIKGKQ